MAVVRTYRSGPHILVAELNRPKIKNAMDKQMYDAMVDAITEYEADDSLHALVFTGAGNLFTAGADLSVVGKELKQTMTMSKNGSKRFMYKLLDCPKVVVAAVNGPAIGIGTTLCTHCDVVLAAPSAFFWTPFMRIGLVPEFASSYIFPRIMGEKMANEMLMRSKQIDAETAKQCGIVSEVLPAENFLQEALSRVNEMVGSEIARENLVHYKRLGRGVELPRIKEAIELEYEYLDDPKRAATTLKLVANILSKSKL